MGLLLRAGRLDGCQVRQRGLSGEGALEVGSGQGTCGEADGHARSSMARWREREAGEKEAGQSWGGRSWRWSLPHPPRSRASALAPAVACQGPPPRLLRPGPIRREHHDSVLHDGADAGLGRGLLHLQPHAGRPPELPAPLRHQRLLP